MSDTPLELRLYIRNVSGDYDTAAGETFLDRVGGRVWEVYSYIPQFHHHICSLTPYYECYLVGYVTNAMLGVGEVDEEGEAYDAWWEQHDNDLHAANVETPDMQYFDCSEVEKSSIDDSASYDGSRAWHWDDLEEALRERPAKRDPLPDNIVPEFHAQVREYYAGGDISSTVSRYLRAKESE